jgi:uncharacterized membrane protein
MTVTTDKATRNASTKTHRDPFRWLALGWRDFRRTPLLSGAYGLVLAGLFYSTTYAAGHVPVLTMSFVTGFLLVAPFLATGIYGLSRRLEQGESPTLRDMLTSGKQNFWSIASFGVFLALVLLAWGRFTGLAIALSFPALGPEDYLLTWETLFSVEGLGFLVLLIGVGLVLGTVAFATSAVSLPMLVDKPVDILTAVGTSWRCVSENMGTMAIWAILIVTLTLAGVALYYVGLALVLPLIAHATWHAYRGLVTH